eukprot:TRINITY_DN62772_c0_g2_i2.p1 TRINITY_DN62772_c0_g2~~TRINITY_DN62772_c0_g2_i2.p1  ORF type:complete len:211 (-),score=30.80 TRINITY_DN62772_c0_g2_i2:1121-1753(-)
MLQAILLQLIAYSIHTVSSNSLTQTEKDVLLARHNVYRCMHDAPPMVWDKTVAAKAQEWADKCKFDHSTRAFRNEWGENLATIRSSGSVSLNASRHVKSWYDEVKDYNTNKPGFSGATGHFTQVVWKASTGLGCGVCRKAKEIILVCQYKPAGNIDTKAHFEENVVQKKKDENDCGSTSDNLTVKPAAEEDTSAKTTQTDPCVLRGLLCC